MDAPRAGVHYPRSTGEVQAWFRTDADCLDYLEWLRWPAGFSCPDCGQGGGWRLGDGRFMCAGCGGRTSVTAGTVFDRTRTPLTVWFNACWLFATSKDGRGLLFYRVLQLAVDHDPVRYRDLIAHPQPEQTLRKPPGARGHPPTLERPPAGRPWRSLRPALLRLNG